MIKTKSAILIMIATLAFTGCGADIPQSGMESSGVLVEDLEVCTESNTRLETNRLTSTTSTAQETTTSTSTTPVTSITTTTMTTTIIAVQTTEFELVTEPIETESVVEVVEPPVEDYELDEPEPYVASQEWAPGDLIRSGMRGTYYAPGSWNGYSETGGSGRALMDCNYGGDGYAKGSIASGYLYDLLGYYANGEPTTVWLCVDGYPEMNGLYYLDDCSGADVIDFFYNANDNCQFSWEGVVSVDVYYAD